MADAARNLVRLPPGFTLLDEQPPRGAMPSPVQLPPGFTLMEDMSAEDLGVPAAPGDPAGEARLAEIKRRNDAASAQEKAWLASRSPTQRAGDTAAFIGSMPVRAVTGGNKGVGDILRAFGFEDYAKSYERSEQDFARANPDVIQTLGAVGEVAAGIPALNTMGRVAPPRTPGRQPVSPNTQSAVMRAAEATEDMGAARRLNVEVPGFAYNEGPVASIPKQLSETPIIGAPARRAIERGITDTARAADEVAGQYGDVRTAQQAGQVAEQGITRFKDARPADILDTTARNLDDAQISEVVRQPARETSLKSKQAALYERAWREIPEDMRAGRAVQGQSRVMASPETTRGVLREIIDRNARMTQQSGAGAAGVSMPVSGGLLGRMMEAINNPRWTANLQTLRDMRSEIRRLASGMADTEKNTLRLSDLERLQGAITQDMIGLLARNAERYRAAGDATTARGFERSIRMFQQADRFTALSAQRLETIERMFNAPNAEALSRNITQAALNQGRGNIAALRTLRRILQPEEMSQIASGVIREMGTPVGSARGMTQQAGWSAQSFLTRYQNMSPAARNILFSGPHRQAFDDLVRVNSRIANIEALSNTSRTGTNTLNVGGVLATGGAVASGAIDSITAGMGAAGAGFGAAVLMSRPEYARWMVKYLQLRARAKMATDGQSPRIAEHVRALALMAQQDPDLEPVVRQIASENR